MLAGQLPHLPTLVDGRLIAPQKPTVGVHPIAIQEVWVRIASLCALTACPDMGPCLKPLQMGVGVRGGPEITSHFLCAGLDSAPNSAMVSVDFANAVSRATILPPVAG
jgi:hypothetical protein